MIMSDKFCESCLPRVMCHIIHNNGVKLGLMKWLELKTELKRNYSL